MEEILVSEEDKHVLTDFKWHISKEKYVKCNNINNKSWRLHRYIMIVCMENDLTSRNYVDHINGIKTDNRRENLRIATPAENARNKNKSGGASSKYYGVSKTKGNAKFAYRVQFTFSGNRLSSYYNEELHAAWQYNIWVKKYSVEFAKINDIEEPINFIEYKKKNTPIKTLPKYISMYKSKFRVRVKNKQIGIYKILVEAEKALHDYLKKMEDAVASEPIKRNDANIATIYIKNKEILVDDEDYYLLLSQKVHIIDKDNYAKISINGKTSMLHRFIINYEGHDVVDHINGNRLDNRKSNLRIVTRTQNSQNKKSSINSTSKYIGVCFDKSRNKWAAEIRPEGKKKFLGRFNTEEEAAKARDIATIKYFGEFGKLNFPED